MQYASKRSYDPRHPPVYIYSLWEALRELPFPEEVAELVQILDESRVKASSEDGFDVERHLCTKLGHRPRKDEWFKALQGWLKKAEVRSCAMRFGQGNALRSWQKGIDAIVEKYPVRKALFGRGNGAPSRAGFARLEDAAFWSDWRHRCCQVARDIADRELGCNPIDVKIARERSKGAGAMAPVLRGMSCQELASLCANLRKKYELDG